MEQRHNARVGEMEIPRKPADQRHRPARLPHAKIRERPRRESNLVSIGRRRVLKPLRHLGCYSPTRRAAHSRKNRCPRQQHENHVIVSQLDQQVRELHAQVQAEAQQLEQAQRAASSAQQAAGKAEHQVRAVTASLNAAQATLEQANRAAQDTSGELASQSSMLAQAKLRLSQASEQLAAARADG